MLGEFGIFVSTLAGTLAVVLTSVLGGEARELVSEVVQPNEAVTITVSEAASTDQPTPTVLVEKVVTKAFVPTTSPTTEPTPTLVADTEEAVELDDDCVSGDDLAVSSDGQRISVNVNGAEATVCESGDDGESHVETNVESENADVKVKQHIESSSSTNVTSTTKLNVSTN